MPRSRRRRRSIYNEAELPLRVIRDLFTGDFEKALIDDDLTYKRIVGYLKKTSPHMAERVVRYREKEPLFEASGVDAEIRSTLNRRVDLPSGGYLVFDYAEAFTVIDVNTGRFVGSRSKTSGARLEDTITKNNLEAVKEVVRQLRLRDIGGIIVIDFIDMANPKNREQVEEELKQELERDRTKTYVVEISPLGLVEMTRQNVTDGPREILTKRCPTCAGDGIVVSEASLAVEAERKLRALAAQSPRTKAFKVELNAHVAAMLIGPGAERLKEIEAVTKRVFLPEGKEGVPLDHFAVLDKGTLEKLQAQSPYKDGQEIDVKLGEVGAARLRLGGRQARRVRGLRRRRGPARRQEGEGPRRARPRRDDLREPRRRCPGQAGRRDGADHGGRSRREADPVDRTEGRRARSRSRRSRRPMRPTCPSRSRRRRRKRRRTRRPRRQPPRLPARRTTPSRTQPGNPASARGAARAAGAGGASPPEPQPAPRTAPVRRTPRRRPRSRTRSPRGRGSTFPIRPWAVTSPRTTAISRYASAGRARAVVPPARANRRWKPLQTAARRPSPSPSQRRSPTRPPRVSRRRRRRAAAPAAAGAGARRLRPPPSRVRNNELHWRRGQTCPHLHA